MSPREFEEKLSAAEQHLGRLKVLYEQYFLGIERIVPERQRVEFARALRNLRKSPPRNTALKFRLNGLQQRFTTLQSYWTRVCRQIEEGTYRRDVMRAKQRQAARPASAVPDTSYEIDVDLDMDMDAEVDAALAALTGPSPASEPSPVGGSSKPPRRPSLSPFAMSSSPPAPASPAPRPAPSGPVTATFGKPKSSSPRAGAAASFGPPSGTRPPKVGGVAPGPKVASAPPPRPRVPRPVAADVRAAAGLPPRSVPPPPPSRRPKPKPAAPPGGVAEARMRGIYDEYLAARRRNNERVDNVKYETLKKSISKMVPKLQAKHKGKAIDFEVVVKDGRVGLKPVAKK